MSISSLSRNKVIVISTTIILLLVGTLIAPVLVLPSTDSDQQPLVAKGTGDFSAEPVFNPRVAPSNTDEPEKFTVHSDFQQHIEFERVSSLSSSDSVLLHSISIKYDSDDSQELSEYRRKSSSTRTGPAGQYWKTDAYTLHHEDFNSGGVGTAFLRTQLYENGQKVKAVAPVSESCRSGKNSKTVYWATKTSGYINKDIDSYMLYLDSMFSVQREQISNGYAYSVKEGWYTNGILKTKMADNNRSTNADGQFVIHVKSSSGSIKTNENGQIVSSNLTVKFTEYRTVGSLPILNPAYSRQGTVKFNVETSKKSVNLTAPSWAKKAQDCVSENSSN